MDNGQDRIPSWIGRAVTTADVPVVLEVPPGEGVSTNGSAVVEPEPVADEAEARPGQPEHSAGEREPSASVEQAVEPTQSRRGLYLGLGAAAVVLVFGLLAMNTLSADETETSPDNEVADAVAPAETSVGDTAPEGAAPEDGDSAEDAEEPSLTVTTLADDTGAEDDGASVAIPGLSTAVFEAHQGEAWAAGEAAWAVYTDGKIYLQGQVPDNEAADVLAERLQSILGAENVVAQFTVDPTSPMPVDPPLFIKETVVFAPQSTTMPPGSDWILIVADVLMKRFPATTLTVVADTTAPISEGDAPDLVDQRVEAILTYLENRGIETNRLESSMRSDSAAGVAEGNKPIEFVVRGLLSET